VVASAVGFGFLALCVAAVIAVVVSVSSNDDPAPSYDETECSALIGFARRDDISFPEKARALDDYNANC
jgi:hypothetical protein